MASFLSIVLLLALMFVGFQAFSNASSSSARDDLIPGEDEPPLEMRLRETPDSYQDTEGDAPPRTVQHLELLGQPPVTETTSLLLTYSIFDVTDHDEGYPVECLNNDLREAETCIFQARADLGWISPDRSYRDWVKVHSLETGYLTVEAAGHRKLKIVASLWPSDRRPQWRLGQPSGAHPIWRGTRTVSCYLHNDYLSEDSIREIWGMRHLVRMGVAIAALHCRLEEASLDRLRAWCYTTLRRRNYNEDEFRRRYATVDATASQACTAARQQRLDFEDELSRLTRFMTPALAQNAMALAAELLASKGWMKEAEQRTLDRIATTLRDSAHPATASTTTLPWTAPKVVRRPRVDTVRLGIQSGWSRERIRKHLTAEYRRWNSRATAVEDPERRREAEAMIQLIVEAREALLED